MTSKTFFQRHENVFVYVPNLIGYFRVLSLLASFTVASGAPVTGVALYFISFSCDALDGTFARKFNQSSVLGAVLDMVTDRVSTSGLLSLVCMTAPRYYMIWISLMMLDISSHWFQMYSSLKSGLASHKDIESSNWILRLYYRNRAFMGVCCVSCEVLYLSIFMLAGGASLNVLGDSGAGARAVAGWIVGSPVAPTADRLVVYLLLLAVPGTAIKQVVNVHQLVGAMQLLAGLEMHARQ